MVGSMSSGNRCSSSRGSRPPNSVLIQSSTSESILAFGSGIEGVEVFELELSLEAVSEEENECSVPVSERLEIPGDGSWVPPSPILGSG